MTESNILLESGTNELEIVEFFLDDEREKGNYRGYYGINVAKVLEIIQMPELTEMPDVTHKSVLGAFNLRDEIIRLSTWQTGLANSAPHPRLQRSSSRNSIGPKAHSWFPA